MSGIQWEDPPDVPRRSKYDAIKAELKANPGRWAKIGGFKNRNTAQSIGAGAFKKFGFEYTTREGSLYVRWPEES